MWWVRRRTFGAFAVAWVGVGIACAPSPARMTPRAGLVDLGAELGPLRQQFEADRDFPRAVVLLSPT